MNIIPDKSNFDLTSKVEVEQVQKQKQEYKLIGSFWYHSGHKLFFYDPIENKLGELEILRGNTIHLLPKNGNLIPVDLELEKVVTDSRYTFFSALNYKNAERRFCNWKSGKIKELCNLFEYKDDGINFW